MENNKTAKLVQMRFQPKTLNKLDSLIKLTEMENKTQLVSSSIALAEDIVRSIKQDHAKVYIEMPNGEKELIRLIGM